MKGLLFLALFGAAVLACVALSATRRRPFAWGVAAIGPLLPGTLWFYGVVFDWGNGARIERYLHVRRLEDYLRAGAGPYTVMLCVVGLIALCAGFVLVRRARRIVLSPALGVLILAAWCLCGFFIKDIAFEVLDWRSGNPSATFARWIAWSPRTLLSFLGSLAMGLAAATVATVITLNAARKATPSGATSNGD